MAQAIHLAHFGLRTRDLPTAVEWYARALGAQVHFQNELAVFMSFDEEHHRFVIWDDGETGEKPENARGVDHIGFGCDSPSDLAGHYERLKALEIIPTLCVNHHFTSSLYYRDPDGNEVEITCDNKPTKAQCVEFMATAEMKAAMQPPLFGAEFDPEELVRLRNEGADMEVLSRIGL